MITIPPPPGPNEANDQSNTDKLNNLIEEDSLDGTYNDLLTTQYMNNHHQDQLNDPSSTRRSASSELSFGSSISKSNFFIDQDLFSTEPSAPPLSDFYLNQASNQQHQSTTLLPNLPGVFVPRYRVTVGSFFVFVFGFFILIVLKSKI